MGKAGLSDSKRQGWVSKNVVKMVGRGRHDGWQEMVECDVRRGGAMS